MKTVQCIHASDSGFSIQHRAQEPLGASGQELAFEHSTGEVDRKATLADAETKIRLRLIRERERAVKKFTNVGCLQFAYEASMDYR